MSSASTPQRPHPYLDMCGSFSPCQPQHQPPRVRPRRARGEGAAERHPRGRFKFKLALEDKGNNAYKDISIFPYVKGQGKLFKCSISIKLS